MSDEDVYDSSKIKVLKGLDAVRKRPGMYIGDTDDGTGLHHMVFEVVDNSIDEALAGHCIAITVTIHADRVRHRVRQRPWHPGGHPSGRRRSAAEVIMTVLHAGGKFDDSLLQGFRRSARCRCVGGERAFRVPAADHSPRRQAAKQEYRLGDPQAPLAVTGATPEARYHHSLQASSEIFTNIHFDYDILAKRLRELSFLNSGVRIELMDERDDKGEVFQYEGGLQEFVDYLNRNQRRASTHRCSASAPSKTASAWKSGLQWNDSYNENMFCYTNNIPQKDGGTHLVGFRSALTRTLNTYIEKESRRRTRSPPPVTMPAKA